jgi:hypothetical protein
MIKLLEQDRSLTTCQDVIKDIKDRRSKRMDTMG